MTSHEDKPTPQPAAVDIAAVRESLHHIREGALAQHEAVQTLCDALPPGYFEIETDAPLDLAAKLFVQLSLMVSEYLDPLIVDLEDSLGWTGVPRPQASGPGASTESVS